MIQHANEVVPIEVKAGSTGSLKSLHLFMGLKKLKRAVRVNSDFPSKTEIKMKDSLGNLVSYDLLSIPFYLIGQVHRLL
ncbi:MAG TPA: AAA family ATPase, partial [Gammaproteobacteria bacterium]|nr:AAA family ATPase [Gammaproteobacteria bacterium]